MKIVVFTGNSGSGLTSARYVFEELGYFINELMPPSFISEYITFLENKFKNKELKLCIVTPLSWAKEIYQNILSMKKDVELLVLHCSKDVVIKRFALTRHVHPLSTYLHLSFEDAVNKDLNDVKELLPLAKNAIDTSFLTKEELRSVLYKKLSGENKAKINLTFVSFGIKEGLPLGIDTFFDCRVLPNPYWETNLRDLTGNDKEVKDFISSFKETDIFLSKIVDYLSYFLSTLKVEKKPSYVVGVACTGGKHRSVYVANYLADYYKHIYHTKVIHKELDQNG